MIREIFLVIEPYLILVPLIALIISFLFNIFQFVNSRNVTKQYKEKLLPELDCSYEYHASQNEHKLILKNIGLIDAENIWAQETVYAIIDDEVYEGTDIPHYHYIRWNNSRDKMWNIKKDKSIEIELPALQIKSFYCLKYKYNLILINKWTLSYSSTTSSKKYQFEKYFVFDFEDQTFKNGYEVVGIQKHLDSIQDYILYGEKKTINIFDLSGDFELNTPATFLINQDYSITPLYPSTVCTIEDFNKSLLFLSSINQIQLSDDSVGTIGYTWKFDNGRWEKTIFLGPHAQMYTKPIKLPLAYLSRNEAKLVESNPNLLKYYRKDRPPQAEKQDVIIQKARQKYLK